MIDTTLQISRLTPESALAVLLAKTAPVNVLFDIADGLYWYCANYHGGGGSDEYRILSQVTAVLGFRPSLLANGPETDDAKHVYELLEIDGGHTASIVSPNTT